MPDDVTRLPRLPCPHCAAPMDSVASTDPRHAEPPRPGDFLLCFVCAQPSIYQEWKERRWFRQPTDLELAEFAVDQGHEAEFLKAFRAAQGWDG